MRKFFTLIVALFAITGAFAQFENNPVKWTYQAKKIGPKLYEVHLKATIDKPWHLYAQDAGKGPEPTSIVFDKNPLVQLSGKTKEIGKLEKQYDPNFKSELRFYAGSVDFVQTVKMRSTAQTVVKGSITFMVCNDNRCLPPKEIPFSVTIDGK